MDPSIQADVLEALTEARNYNAWITSIMEPFLGDDPIELGSGLGDQAQLFLERGARRLTVSDLDTNRVAGLKLRFAGDPRVAVRHLDLTAAPTGDHSAALTVNVLEHIEDDLEALRGGARLVRPGGAVVVFTPAFEFAMSRFDREIGHYRRYTKAKLRERFTEAGLRPEKVHYVNAPGLIAWVSMMRLLSRRPQAGRALRAWDSGVIPLTRRLESRIRPPFGQSVFGVGRVP
jgi:SAM-dependent methyltransferase